MSNAWKQIAWIASEALNYLEDSLVIAKTCARDKTSDFMVKPNGYAVGSKVDIRTNPVFEAKEFTTAIEIQNIRSSVREMRIEKHFDVSAKMTAKEKILDMDNFSLQVIKPAAYALAVKFETYLASKILNASSLYTSADLFGDAADLAQAKKAATFQQLSPTGRFCLLNDAMEAKLLGKTYFNTHNSRGESGERVFNDASLGYAFGMDFVSSLYMPELSFAAGNGVGVTNNNSGANNLVGDMAIVTDAITGTNIKAGDRIKIAGVRRQLRVATTVATGATSIPLVDPITEIIPDNAAITVQASGATYDVMGAIFDDSSLAFACPILDPASDKPTYSVSENGLSIRVVQGYDINAKTETISLDMICGAEAYDNRRITLLGDTQ